MDIAALSIAVTQGNLMQDASLSVMKMVMETARSNGEALNQLISTQTKAMELSVQPHLGSKLDINV